MGDMIPMDNDAWTGRMINVGGQLVKEVTLLAAVEEGNSLPQVGNWATNKHIIAFDVAAMGTDVLSLGMTLPALKSNFQFMGNNVTIQPAEGLALRLVIIKSGVDVRFYSMNFRNAYVIGEGGAIENRGSLTLDHCNLYNNYASLGGGAVISYDSIMETGFAGDLKIVSCSFWSNSTLKVGGAIFASGHTNLQITDTDIFANSATGTSSDPNAVEGLGGGLAVTNTLTAPVIQNTRIYGNTAGNNGGGVFVYHTDLSMTGGEIHGNTAYGNGISFYGGWGGGIYVDGDPDNGGGQKTVTLSQVKLTNNAAGAKGGGGYVWVGTLRLTDLTHFSGNTAEEGINGVGYKKNKGTATINPSPPPPGFQMVEEDP
jgi:hypothetical protein